MSTPPCHFVRIKGIFHDAMPLRVDTTLPCYCIRMYNKDAENHLSNSSGLFGCCSLLLYLNRIHYIINQHYHDITLLLIDIRFASCNLPCVSPGLIDTLQILWTPPELSSPAPNDYSMHSRHAGQGRGKEPPRLIARIKDHTPNKKKGRINVCWVGGGTPGKHGRWTWIPFLSCMRLYKRD